MPVKSRKQVLLSPDVDITVWSAALAAEQHFGQRRASGKRFMLYWNGDWYRRHQITEKRLLEMMTQTAPYLCLIEEGRKEAKVVWIAEIAKENEVRRKQESVAFLMTRQPDFIEKFREHLEGLFLPRLRNESSSTGAGDKIQESTPIPKATPAPERLE